MSNNCINLQDNIFNFTEDMVAPEFVTALTAATVTEGQTAHLECRVTAKPQPEIRWTVDGKAVKDSDNVKIEKKTDGTQMLTIEQATETQKGQYVCEASNKAGKTQTAAQLTVKGGRILYVVIWKHCV